MGEGMKIGRREFLTGIYSKDSLKKVLTSFYVFKEEMDKSSRLSCDEIGMRMRKAKVKVNRKEG
jgi:hypothetical protein